VSRLHPTDVEWVELGFSCIKCHAVPGKWCTRLGEPGAAISYLHRQRFDSATRAGLLPLVG
jgi:hypothetical protein